MPTRPDPSDKDLLSFSADIRSLYTNRDKEINELRKLIFLSEDPELPTMENMPVARAPLAYEAVRTQIGHLTANPPRVTVHPATEGDDDQNTANRLEKTLGALLQKLSEASPFIEEVLWSAIADSVGVLKAGWLPWADYPLQSEDEKTDDYNKRVADYVKRAPTPFSLQSVDPLTYYPLYGPTGLEAVVEYGYRPQLWLSREFASEGIAFSKTGRVTIGSTRPALGIITGGSVEYHEIWTRTHVYYLVGSKLVRTIAHGYPCIPYFEVQGEVTNSRETDKQRKAFVWPFAYLQPLYDTLLNSIGHQALRAAHPSYYEQRSVDSPNDLGANDQPITIGFDEIISGKRGATLVPMAPPPLSSTVIETMQLLSSLMDRTGGNPILAGYGMGSRTPGVSASLFMEAAKARLQATSRSGGNALKQALQFFLWLTANKVRKPIYLLSIPDANKRRESMHINPGDVNKIIDFDVDLPLTLPQDDFARHMDAINLKNNTIWSLRRAMETAGVDNPTEEFQRIIVEQFLMSPDVRNLIVQAALKKRGIGQSVVEGQAATEIIERMVGGQMPGGASAQAGIGAGGGGIGVGQPGNTPLTSLAPREPGLTYPTVPSGPGNPAQQAPGAM